MESPFNSTESDFDPIMIAARLAHERRSSTAVAPPHPTVHPIMTPSFSTTTATQQQKQPIWRHSRNASSDIPFFPINLPPSESTPISIMVLGKTGDGKSSLLNDILGHQVFKQKASVRSQTQEVVEHQGFWAPLDPYLHGKQTFGCHVRVFDTPGFGDSLHRDDIFLPMIKEHIMKVATLQDTEHEPLESGMHCFLMVFKVTTSEEQVFKSLDIVQSLLGVPSQQQQANFWDNVILVFTHADLNTIHRYQSNKVALKTKVTQHIKERYHLSQELPMVFMSTQKYTCSFIKGLGECDCERGNRYNADSRRRLYEQVWKRRSHPFYYWQQHDNDGDEKDQGTDSDGGSSSIIDSLAS